MSEVTGASLWTNGNRYHVSIPTEVVQKNVRTLTGLALSLSANTFDLNGRSLQEVLNEASRIRRGECFKSWEEFDRFGKVKRTPCRKTKEALLRKAEDIAEHRMDSDTSADSDGGEKIRASGKENAHPPADVPHEQDDDLHFENAIRGLLSAHSRSKRLPLGGLQQNVMLPGPSDNPADQLLSKKQASKAPAHRKSMSQKNSVHELVSQNRKEKGLPKMPRSLVKHTSVWLSGRHSLLPLPAGKEIKRKSRTGACGELSRFGPILEDDPDQIHTNSPCPWHVRAIRRAKSGEFKITKCHLTHTCAQQCHRWRGPCSKAKWLGETLAPVVIRHVKGPVKELSLGFQQDYKRNTSYHQMWRAKDLVRDAYLGGQRKSFHCIPGLIERLKIVDPGCIAEWSAMDGSDVFCRAFVCPSATQLALRYCQPVLCLDACHTKNRKYPTQLFLATVLDGNMEVLCTCFAVAPTENLDNWTWFLKLLYGCLEGVELVIVPFISDRCKGLISAVKEVFPGKVHGMCANHLRGNVKKEYGQTAERFFLATVYANTREFFDELLEVLEHSSAKGEAAAKYIGELDPRLYARHAFPLPRFGHVTSNPCEATNSGLLPIREYAPFKLIVEMWFYMQAHFNKRRQNASECKDTLTRPALLRHKHNLTTFGQFQVFDDCGGTAKVQTTTGSEEYLVTRSPKKTCTCFELQDMCWPCEHIMAWDDLDAKPFAAHFHICLRVSSLRKLYEGIIPSFLCNDIAVSNRCWPPEVAVNRGRHRVVRIASGRKVSRATGDDVEEDVGIPQMTGDDVEEDEQGNLYLKYPIDDDHNLVDAMPTPGTVASAQKASEEQEPLRKTRPKSGRCRCRLCGVLGHNKRTCKARNSSSGEAPPSTSTSNGPPTHSTCLPESQEAGAYEFSQESQVDLGVTDTDYRPDAIAGKTSGPLLDDLIGLYRSVPRYMESDEEEELEDEEYGQSQTVRFGTSQNSQHPDWAPYNYSGNVAGISQVQRNLDPDEECMW